MNYGRNTTQYDGFQYMFGHLFNRNYSVIHHKRHKNEQTGVERIARKKEK